MKKTLISYGRWLAPVPEALWRRRILQGGKHAREHLAFMSADHHRVRDFAVTEIPRRGMPLSPLLIASELNMATERVGVILTELEKHMTFLFRNEEGHVAWAYPVTAEPTPHRVYFSSGEQCYAA